MIKRAALLTFLVILSLLTALSAEEYETGWIEGQLMIKDRGAMSDGMVVFFDARSGPPPSLDRYFRIPDEVGVLDAEGKFRVPLMPGKYYMGAIKRISGEKAGPPLDGDYFSISQDKEGKPLAYVIEKGKDLNIGTISDAVPFKRTIAEGVTGISGIILDMTSNPVEGAIVFAYITETMTGLPPFTSYKTGKDGKYFIGFDKGGKYYLRVRDIYGGGPPIPGAIMGAYGETSATAVAVKTGEITKGIDIKVVRHLEMGPKGQHTGIGVDKNIQEEQKKKTKEEVEKTSGKD